MTRYSLELPKDPGFTRVAGMAIGAGHLQECLTHSDNLGGEKMREDVYESMV